MTLPTLDQDYLVNFLTGLLDTPSPTGLAEPAIAYTELALGEMPGLKVSRSRKGLLLAELPGKRHDAPRALSAHADTLGAMVKEIKDNGRLRITQVGGFAWNTVEGEGCSVFSSSGKVIRGSLLITTASGHIHGKKTADTARDDENMEIRLDERTANATETRAIGVEVGDYVAFDPRVELVNGFIRSRHLDNKAGVACIVAAIRAIVQSRLTPVQTTCFVINSHEEIGHPVVGLPAETAELVVVDMAAVGPGQTSDEFHASICVKDSSGPYDHKLSTRLREIATRHEIPYKVDVYPFYSSDGSASLRAGGDLPVTLIGPGVDASHNYERTHLDALTATTRWIMAYLLEE